MSLFESDTPRVGGKYLTFQLAEEEYGIGILQVQEILQHAEITPIPKTPDYFEGIINLRAHVIPAINLRTKLGLPFTEPTDHTCIIVVETQRGDRKSTVGLIVDGVSEVIDIRSDDIEKPPEFLQHCSMNEAIIGIAKHKGTVKTLLNVSTLLNAEDIQLVKANAS